MDLDLDLDAGAEHTWEMGIVGIGCLEMEANTEHAGSG